MEPTAKHLTAPHRQGAQRGKTPEVGALACQRKQQPPTPHALRRCGGSRSTFYPPRPPRPARGIALIVVVAVVFTLSAMALGLAAYLQADQRDVRLYVATVQAEYAAESGIQKLRFLLEQEGPPIKRREQLGEAQLQLSADGSPTRLTALATVGEVSVRMTAQASPVFTGTETVYRVAKETLRKERLGAAK